MTIGFDTYLVGGAVRDELLGLPVADRDWVVVGATSEVLLSLGFIPVGADFPCFLHPQSKEEYALARTKRNSLVSGAGLGAGSNNTGQHYINDFSPEVTLEQDLLNRDLTINGMAKSMDGVLIDPSNGYEDLQQRVLRHVGPTFCDDPIRVLRVARFAARYQHLGFTVHTTTQELMAEMVTAGELNHLTPERVWKEIYRALSSPKPSVFFQVLRDCGALEALMPELDCLFGVPQPAEHHPEIDSGLHVMMAVDQARQRFDEPQVTWAAVMHDLGKGVTPKQEWPRHIGHEQTGVPLVAAVCARFNVPKDYRELARLVAEHHLRCHRLLEAKPKGIMALLEALDGLRRPQRVQRFAQACTADALGRLGREQAEYPQAALLESCLEAATEVDIKPLLAKGYSGEALADQIRQLRIAAIRNYLKHRQSCDPCQ